MKIVSIDTETTSLLDCAGGSVLELGAVIDNLEKPYPVDSLPTFHCYIKQDVYVGQPYALSMNAEILKRIATEEEGYTYLTPEEVGPAFKNWLESNGFNGKYDYTKSGAVLVNAAGKNFPGFDKPFLNRLPNFAEHVQFPQRVFDPSPFWTLPDDFRMPDLQTCMQRAGLDGIVTHTAVEDAKVVIELIRRGLKVIPLS